MSDSSRAIPAFNLAAAFVRAARAMLTHGWLPLLMAFVTGLIFIALSMAVMALMLTQAGEAPGEGGRLNTAWLGLVMAVCWVAIAATSQMLAAQAVHQARVGEKARFSATFRSLWQDGPMALLLLFCQWLLIAVGLVMLIVPGVIFAVLFSMVIAARVADGGGPVRAFQESVNTLKGNGWMLALYLLVGNILGTAVVIGGNALGQVASRAMQNFIRSNDSGNPLVAVAVITALVSFVVFTVACPFLFGLFPAAAYAELKASRDDRTVAKAFD